MPHYRDGTAAQIGDYVRGTGYNVKHADGTPKTLVGRVVQIVPEAASCNIRVAHVIIIEPKEPLNHPDHRFFTQAARTVLISGDSGLVTHAAALDIEYGQCDSFEKIG